ncbi:hypothetical protein [Streptomyces sp. ISID311]|uniref:hypothetical protein n=1 Tax=Streptomyces sp. ISID311 TaxID=2601673 RepID=UPI00164A25F6|nr:hypothetical protein [Streptomyces sp. ISID311]
MRAIYDRYAGRSPGRILAPWADELGASHSGTSVYAETGRSKVNSRPEAAVAWG